jgi:uncharacterized protein (TIGR00369 family)
VTPTSPVYGLTPVAEATALSGLAFLQGMLEGRLPSPPFSRATGIRLSAVEHGRAVFEGEPDAGFFNPIGTIHGGWTAAILDSAMACAVHATLQPGQAYTTVEMKLNYVRAVMPGRGLVTCEGRVVHVGNRIATSEGYLRDAEGRLLAHGTETCMIMQARTE